MPLAMRWAALLGGLAFGGGQAPQAFLPRDYEMTSGELRLASGEPVLQERAAAPALEVSDSSAVYASDSPVFRMRSKEADYADVEVSVELVDRSLRSGLFTAQHAWDGIHLWLRYQNPAFLYAVSVNRRDGRVVIKKKVPGGSSNGGTYYDLGETAAYAVPFGEWQSLAASASNQADGSVRLALTVDGRTILEAIDDGSQGGAPISMPGRVGLRADNADFQFRNLRVTPLGGQATAR